MQPAARQGRLRSRSWHRVSPGLYHSDTGRVLDAWQLALPASGRFTHLTAVALRGWWAPLLPEGLPVLVAVDAAATRPQRVGLRVVRADPVAAYTTLDGLRVDSVVDTLLACARDLALLDLVVLVDSALHAGDCRLDELAEVAAGRRKGARRLREALRLADARSESAWETLLRVLLTVAGYEVEPQKRLLDDHGDEVARLDLWLVGTTSAAEYDGAHHLTREQQRVDLVRQRRIAALGWVRRGYTSNDVLHRAAAVLRDAELATGRPPRTGAFVEWCRLVAESCYSPAGRERLARRLGPGGSGTHPADGDVAPG